MSGGVVTAAVKNSGNVHLFVRTVFVQGKDGADKLVLTKELSGWYLLAGAQRIHTAEVPADVCREIARVDVEVRTETLSFTGSLVADPSMCETK
jgi:hypothetical protein